MTPDEAIPHLLADPLCSEIVGALAPGPCYLVGGAVRDLLVLGRDSPDWDLIVETDARRAGEQLVSRLGGRLVRMGSGRFATFRVVLPNRVLDVCDQGGTSLDVELLRRDLTINSIAIDLSSGKLVDPAGGLPDAAAGILRANAQERFTEDPVRTLRLVRFSLDLPEFAIDRQTTEAARAGSPLLAAVAAERVRAELDDILGRRPRRRLSDLLSSHDLFPLLWDPEAVSGEVGSVSLVTLDEVDDSLTSILEAGAQSPPRTDLVAMHHAVLLTVAGGDSAVRLLDNLLARGYVTRSVGDLARRLLEPIPLPESDADRRLFVDFFGDSWVAAASLAVPASGEALERLIALALAEARSIRGLAPLLDGHDMVREFGVTPGPELGRLLHSLRREQVTGSIRTVDEARRWLATRLEESSSGDPTCRPGSAGSTP